MEGLLSTGPTPSSFRSAIVVLGVVLVVGVIVVVVVMMVVVVVVVVVVLGNWRWRSGVGSGGDSLCKGGSCNSCMSAIVKVGWCWWLLWW